MIVKVKVNGAERSADVEPRVLLVDFLRTNLRLTGTHVGCDTSSCGACTVLLDGEPVKSCTLLAVQVEGQSITTVEGLAAGSELTPATETRKRDTSCPVSQRNWSNSWTPISMKMPPLVARKAAAGGRSSH